MIGSAEFVPFEIDLNARCVCGCMEGNRIHKIYRFPNYYGASVVSGPKGGEAQVGRFRMFVLRFESPPPDHCWEIASDTSITGGEETVECADWEEVEQVLRGIMALPRP